MFGKILDLSQNPKINKKTQHTPAAENGPITVEVTF